MKGDFHVRFRGNAGVKLPCVTRLPHIVKNDSDNNIHRINCWTKLHSVFYKDELSENREINSSNINRLGNFVFDICNF